MKNKYSEIRKENNASNEKELLNRRDFMIGLKKWSKAVIGGALLAGALTDREASAAAWINGGRSWINGGGGGWVNRRGGGGWINRR